MGEMIGAVIGLLLALYGAADLIARLCYRIVFSQQSGQPPLLLVVQVGGDAEYRIRRFAAWCRVCPSGGFLPTVLLNQEDGMLRRLCEELRLSVCTQQEWDEMHKTALQAGESAV